ncbi:MAG: hypothetical protein ACJAUD_000336 [Crocinitomicaceae bacterium]|jgi:hypothetical protein
MTETDIYNLRFPIGKFVTPESISDEQLKEWIESIREFPVSVFGLCSKLSEQEINWIYRPGGWAIKQVIHHCADSHMNSLIRFKLALTEDRPTIRPYKEGLWADLVDSQDNDIRNSINILAGTHKKWVMILLNLRQEDMHRGYIHPEHNKYFSIGEAIGLYAWHCNHHLAHIQLALKSKGSFNASNN